MTHLIEDTRLLILCKMLKSFMNCQVNFNKPKVCIGRIRKSRRLALYVVYLEAFGLRLPLSSIHALDVASSLIEITF